MKILQFEREILQIFRVDVDTAGLRIRIFKNMKMRSFIYIMRNTPQQWSYPFARNNCQLLGLLSEPLDNQMLITLASKEKQRTEQI